MADLVYIAVIVGFFVLCVAYVVGLDRLVGPDPDDLADDLDPQDRPSEAATTGGSR